MLILKTLNTCQKKKNAISIVFLILSFFLNKIALETSISPQVPEGMKSDITEDQVLHIFQLVLALLCDLIGMETLSTSHLGILPYGDRCNRTSSTSHEATGGSQDSHWSTVKIQSKLFPIIFTYNAISCGSTLSCAFKSKIQQSKSLPSSTIPSRDFHRSEGREKREVLKAGGNGVIPSQTQQDASDLRQRKLSLAQVVKWGNEFSAPSHPWYVIACSTSISG